MSLQGHDFIWPLRYVTSYCYSTSLQVGVHAL